MSFLDFFFPRLTPAETGGLIREHLRAASVPLLLREVELRRMGRVHLDRIAAAALLDHRPVLRQAIHLLKYRKMSPLSGILAALLPPLLPLLVSDAAPLRCALCPVPLHWRRRFARGFNQAELLARHLSEKTGLPLEHPLRRIRSTGSQVGRDRVARERGVTDAFACCSDPPPHVILIDDVFTTGATLEACAEALKKAGVQRVSALVLALG